MPKTIEFIALLRGQDGFTTASRFYSEHSTLINTSYLDEQNNTLIHLIFLSFIENLRVLWKPYEDKKYPTVLSLLPYHEKTKAWTSSCLSLIDLLIRDGASFRTRNTGGKRAVDLFRDVDIKHCNIAKVEKAIIKFYELKENCLYSGRKYVADINLFWSSRTPNKNLQVTDKWPDIYEIDNLDLNLHQRFMLYENILHQKRMLGSASNVVIANIGFIVSSKPHAKGGDHTRRFVTLPISDPEYLVFTYPTPNKRGGVHSEEALSKYIKQKEVIQSIIQKLKTIMAEPGIKIYAIILDIHSTREVCHHCDEIIHKLQTEYDDTSFLKSFEQQVLQDNYFVLPNKSSDRENRDLGELSGNKLPLLVRLSGKQDPGLGYSSMSYPLAGTYPDFQHDAKKHYRGVRFHLPPKNYEHRYSHILHDAMLADEKDELKRMYAFVSDIDQATLAIIKQQESFAIYSQTAFVNGAAYCIRRTHAWPDDVINIDVDDLLPAIETTFQF